MVIRIALGMSVGAGVALAKPGGLKRMDADGDGNVTYEEFMSQARERFSKIDENDDGVVTKEEAQAAFQKNRGDRRKGQRGKRKGFSKLFQDRNEDGVVTVEDLPERGARLFQRVDSDENGEISAEENAAFLERVKERRGEKRGGKKRKGKKKDAQ